LKGRKLDSHSASGFNLLQYTVLVKNLSDSKIQLHKDKALEKEYFKENDQYVSLI
jgi:hypothetical protein